MNRSEIVLGDELGTGQFGVRMNISGPDYEQFEQLERRSLKKIRASTGFEPVTSAIPVRCSTN